MGHIPPNSALNCYLIRLWREWEETGTGREWFVSGNLWEDLGLFSHLLPKGHGVDHIYQSCVLRGFRGCGIV